MQNQKQLHCITHVNNFDAVLTIFLILKIRQVTVVESLQPSGANMPFMKVEDTQYFRFVEYIHVQAKIIINYKNV